MYSFIHKEFSYKLTKDYFYHNMSIKISMLSKFKPSIQFVTVACELKWLGPNGQCFALV